MSNHEDHDGITRCGGGGEITTALPGQDHLDHRDPRFETATYECPGCPDCVHDGDCDGFSAGDRVKIRYAPGVLGTVMEVVSDYQLRVAVDMSGVKTFHPSNVELLDKTADIPF